MLDVVARIRVLDLPTRPIDAFYTEYLYIRGNEDRISPSEEDHVVIGSAILTSPSLTEATGGI